MARPAITKTKVVELLSEHHLLSAVELTEKLSFDNPSFNKSTTYRTLEKMVASGEICIQTFADNKTYFELADHHHSHAVCTQCQTVATFQPENIDPTQLPANFAASHCHYTVFGICSLCQNSNKAN